MSDYHVLTQDTENKMITVVFHIPVPTAGTNSAGISWRDAMVKEQSSMIDTNGNPVIIRSRMKDISAGEDTSLKNGSLVEVVENVRFSVLGLTPAQKRTEIIARYNQVKTTLITQKQTMLEWIGAEGNVP